MSPFYLPAFINLMCMKASAFYWSQADIVNNFVFLKGAIIRICWLMETISILTLRELLNAVTPQFMQKALLTSVILVEVK